MEILGLVEFIPAVAFDLVPAVFRTVFPFGNRQEKDKEEEKQQHQEEEVEVEKQQHQEEEKDKQETENQKGDEKEQDRLKKEDESISSFDQNATMKQSTQEVIKSNKTKPTINTSYSNISSYWLFQVLTPIKDYLLSPLTTTKSPSQTHLTTSKSLASPSINNNNNNNNRKKVKEEGEVGVVEEEEETEEKRENNQLIVQNKRKSKTTIYHLPDELLLYILSFIPLHELVENIYHVNKRWRTLSINSRFWTELTLGDRQRPGLIKINGHVIHLKINQEIEDYFKTMKKELPRVKSLRVYDSRPFPRKGLGEFFVGLQSLHMDTYDFIRLEKDQIVSLKKLNRIDLYGSFVAHHEARKILQNISKFESLESFSTNSLIEPHIDLKAEELGPVLESLKYLRSFGVLYDPPNQPDFWIRLPSLPNLSTIAVGLFDLSSPLPLQYFLGWVSSKLPNLRVLYLQLLTHPSSQRDIEVMALQFEALKQVPSIQNIYLDLCDSFTETEANIFKTSIEQNLPTVTLRVSLGETLVNTLFLSDKIFSHV